MDLLSIICTVKNGDNTITDSIESVINQTFKNWELIIIDDGSTDKTTEILLDYKSKDERIKVILTKGIGRAQALNKAIEHTRGSYICNIDADDLFHPDKLKVQKKIVEMNPNHFLFATDSLIIRNKEQPTWNNYNNYNKHSFSDIRHTILVKNQINHSSVIMNGHILRSLGGYNEKRNSQFDYELWLRSYVNKYKLGKINYKLTAKRIHNNQTYENKKRIIYLYRSVLLQLKYIVKDKKRIYYLFVPPIRFLAGLLPFGVRNSINRYLKR